MIGQPSFSKRRKQAAGMSEASIWHAAIGSWAAATMLLAWCLKALDGKVPEADVATPANGS
jgi:hypothetical protein